eukprot:8222484-Pyramimonas_sp.AAC.1
MWFPFAPGRSKRQNMPFIQKTMRESTKDPRVFTLAAFWGPTCCHASWPPRGGRPTTEKHRPPRFVPRRQI